MQQLKEYQGLLQLPGARSLLLLSLVVRGINIPIGAIITVISFELSGSWGLAALSGGIAAGSSALVMWLSGKAMDIYSPRKVLLAFAPGGLVPLLFLLEPQGAALLLVSFLLGLTRPPSGTTIRTSWARLSKREDDRLLAYGLDASLVPIAGALGALFSGLLVGFFGVFSLIVFLTFMATSSTILLAFHKTTVAAGARKSFSFHEILPGKKGPSLEKLGYFIWLVVLLAALSWGALVGLEIWVGERFGPQMLLFVTALGGVAVALGALANNRAEDRSGKSSLVLASFTACLSLVLITLAFLTQPLLALPAVILFGLCRGVISASGSTYLSIASPKERRSEALALYGSGVLLGQAIYRPLAGVLVFSAPLFILLLPAALFLLAALALQKNREEKSQETRG